MSPLARTTAGVLLLVCAALLAGPVRAANSGDVRNAVVKITSTGPDGQRRSGAGFIVKLEADAVFIVTAAHVVEGDKTPRVELFTRPLPVKAEVAQLDLQLDVALLVVHGRDSPLSGLRSLPLDLAGSSAVGQDVTTIGFPAGLSWALSKPNIASQEGIHLAVVGGNIDEGSSGGPVLDNGTVVAMVTTAQRGAGRAIPAQFLGFVLRGWRLDLAGATAAPQPSPPDTAPTPPPTPAPAQALTWERMLGPTMAHEIHRTGEGNYILSGYTRQEGDSRAFDALVAKLDPSGRVIWQRNFPTGGDDDLIYSIAELPGEGYVVGGDKTGAGAWLAALDGNGNPLWERTFPEMKSTMIWRIRRAHENGVIVAGAARSDPGDRREVWVMKLDQRGTVLWRRSYWNPAWENTAQPIPFALCPTRDRGYLIAATTGWVGAVWLLKLDENGDVQWKRALEREGGVYDIIEPRQGGYLLAGAVSVKGGERAWIAQLERDGRSRSEQQFDALGTSRFFAVSEMADGGYLAAGEHIVRLDAHGALVWKQELDGEAAIISIERTADGGQIAAGFRNKAVWVLKLDAQGRLSAAK